MLAEEKVDFTGYRAETIDINLVDPARCRTNNYDDYFINRAKRILDLIESVTGKKIDGRDSAVVIRDFGNSLI